MPFVEWRQSWGPKFMKGMEFSRIKAWLLKFRAGLFYVTNPKDFCSKNSITKNVLII